MKMIKAEQQTILKAGDPGTAEWFGDSATLRCHRARESSNKLAFSEEKFRKLSTYKSVRN